MKPRITRPSRTGMTILWIISGVVLCTTVILLPVISSQRQSIVLLGNEIKALQSDTELIGISKEIFGSQQSKIDAISRAFPDEETIVQFIGELESILKADTIENKFQMTDAPITESGKQYLLYTVSGKAEFGKFTKLLSDIEKMPYLTHIPSISLRTPDGLAKTVEYSFLMKVYVKNPFSIR